MQYIIADRTDCDGIISHALLKRELISTKHFLSDYYDFHMMLNEIIKEPKGNIIVADIDLNSDIRRYTYLFERAKRKHKIFAWFDHHVGSLSTTDFLINHCSLINVQKDKCASMLIAESFGLDDDYSKWLVKIAQDYDYKNKTSEEYTIAQKLQEVIRSDFPNERLIEILAKDERWHNSGSLDDSMEVYRQEFLRKKPEAYSALERTLVQKEICGLNVMFGLATMTLYRSDAPIYLKENKGNLADLYIVFFLNDYGPVMIYGNNDSVRVTDLCSKLGGGGRENNGGFTFGNKTSPENYNERIDYVSNAITNMQNNLNLQNK